MLTCTWAPTTFRGTGAAAAAAALAAANTGTPVRSEPPVGASLRALVRGYVERLQKLGITHLLIPQRWWGSGRELAGSSLDCMAMTGWISAYAERINLVTAVHPGFMQPATVAKWGATLDNLTDGRWAVNLTSGWNLTEFRMYGVAPLAHEARYARAAEFAEILRRAWTEEVVNFSGEYYQVSDLRLEPRPTHPLTIFQGGQSPAAFALAAKHSDWLFLNGGSPERIHTLIEATRAASATTGRTLRFALYATPLCRPTDAEAWAEIEARLASVDPAIAQGREASAAGARELWPDDDPLGALEANHGYASRLIGSPETILARIAEFRAMGIEMLHLDLRDRLFQQEVLPHLQAL
jgi:FMNH2-dependent dimethyl sulfone monooxygenase